MRGDSKLLFQTFSSLLDNAIKYSSAAPRIALRATRTEKHDVGGFCLVGGIEFIRAGRREGDPAITYLSRAILGATASRKRVIDRRRFVGAPPECALGAGQYQRPGPPGGYS